jgi:hypothetical protein
VNAIQRSGLLHLPEALFAEVHRDLVEYLSVRHNLDFLQTIDTLVSRICLSLSGSEIDLRRDLVDPLCASLALEFIGITTDRSDLSAISAGVTQTYEDNLIQSLVVDRVDSIWEHGPGTSRSAALGPTGAGQRSRSDKSVAVSVGVSLVEAIIHTFGDILVSSFAYAFQDVETIGQLAGTEDQANRTAEEFLRIGAQGTGAIRFVRDSILIGDHLLCSGELLLVPPRAVNFDPVVFVEPARFNPGRTTNARHLAFGIPPFDCPAASLARTQLRRVLRSLAITVPDLRSSGPINASENALYHEVTALPVQIG